VGQRVEKFRREPLADLGAVPSGELVEVELVIESKNDYEYLLFEDMKAAGFEPVELQSGYTQHGLGAYTEFRDNRVTFFVRQLPRGKHSLAYRLRAEVPGAFSALPARGAGMYSPELKANSAERKLRVTDAE
jgi:alpha-2-macroglobulin